MPAQERENNAIMAGTSLFNTHTHSWFERGSGAQLTSHHHEKLVVIPARRLHTHTQNVCLHCCVSFLFNISVEHVKYKNVHALGWEY